MPDSCLNCGGLLTGAFCAACGQPRVDLAAPSWHVMRDAVADITDVDGRLVRTIRALGTPGILTTEFLVGRRVPYVGPLKLFLGAGTILTSTWILTRGVDARFYGLPAAGGEVGGYIDMVVRGFIAAGFGIASTNWLLARGRRSLLDDVVFALHLLTAVALAVSGAIWLATIYKLLWGTVGAVPNVVPSVITLVFAPTVVLVLGYVVAAIRRVYGGAWWVALARALLLVSIGVVVVTLVLSLRVPG